VFLEPQKPL